MIMVSEWEFCSCEYKPCWVKNLSYELRTVVSKWYQLGTRLGIPTWQLSIIGEKQDAERRTMETLILWLRYAPTASWKDVVIALKEMEENTVAERIRSKYIRGASRWYSKSISVQTMCLALSPGNSHVHLQVCSNRYIVWPSVCISEQYSRTSSMRTLQVGTALSLSLLCWRIMAQTKWMNEGWLLQTISYSITSAVYMWRAQWKKGTSVLIALKGQRSRKCFCWLTFLTFELLGLLKRLSPFSIEPFMYCVKQTGPLYYVLSFSTPSDLKKDSFIAGKAGKVCTSIQLRGGCTIAGHYKAMSRLASK